MILFPFAKVNIGLEVLRKRSDSFHDLETIFYPLNLCDILEMNKSDAFHFSISGLQIGDSSEKNIVEKAYWLLQSEYNLQPVHIHLHKQIPTGAGLGGGSSDAAFTLLGINELFHLKLNERQLINYASKLGSDCAFFIIKKPIYAEGKGNIFSESSVNLKDYSLVLIKPALSVSTSVAYRGVEPKVPEYSLKESVKLPIELWKERIQNRFEKGIFYSFPQIKLIKERLYSEGALYASMSGSGSSVYGIFDVIPPQLRIQFPDCFYWEENCRF